MNTQLSNELQLDPASLKTLQWLIGSLRHQGRTLLSIQEERTGLLHSVRNSLLLIYTLAAINYLSVATIRNFVCITVG